MKIVFDRKKCTYHVSDFNGEHNHDLHVPICVHLLRCQRNITESQAVEVDLAYDVGLTQKKSFDLFSVKSGGREHVGFLPLDQKNYFRTKRERGLQFGEVGSLLMGFKDQASQDPSFFYAFQLDNEEQITNIFWADGRMRMDYELFGDIVTFDTTFATNKDHRPLGVFIGFNHYREQVIFGASLLYDETQASFDWVFSTFLEAHNFKKPTTLFTDQDIAMGNAISVVMPEVRHGLCTFHIMQNAIKHLGNLMKDDSCFLSDFKALMFEYEDVTKFEKEWEALLKKYKVHGHSWLERTYALKEKWARCYMKTTVTLGVRSTQLSESMNAKLKKSLKSKLDIPTFFKLFGMVVSDKRYREVEAEYNAKEKMPRVKVSCLPLLKQARKVYTPKIFELFQRQWEKSLLALVGNKQERGRLQEYLIVSCDEEGEYVVTHDEENATLLCSCNKFETVGILCGHALKVLDVLGIKYIPETYILKRWIRGAREGCALEEDGLDVHRSRALDVSDRYRELWPDAVRLAHKASEFKDGTSSTKVR
ncbi:hypothetical protein RJ640_012317 [Escallonia rubra]|uniref:SWIM-type domain-containing protein n=1 Tax=Escallonia rubra TaxID=112253 RepID=A0AA88S0N7_9ASTE|nr:hypothetical protein RJ640_012317 [Escallonia rubra]